MNENDPYEGRRPAFNFRGQVRGFRSKPGTTAFNPANTVESPSGFTSNWDSIFRNTHSNSFGRNGQINPDYQAQIQLPQKSVARPQVTPSTTPNTTQPPMPWDQIMDERFTGYPSDMPDDIAKDDKFGGGSTLSSLTDGSDHAKQWEQKAARTTQYPQNKTTANILNRYQTKKGNNGFGWDTAFNDEEDND